MARKHPPCPQCPHAISSHIEADHEYADVRGCNYCECRWHRPAPPAPPPLILHRQAADQLLTVALLMQAAIAQSDATIAHLKGTVHGTAGSQIRMAYVAATDIIAALGQLIRTGELRRLQDSGGLVGLTPGERAQVVQQTRYVKGWQ